MNKGTIINQEGVRVGHWTDSTLSPGAKTFEIMVNGQWYSARSKSDPNETFSSAIHNESWLLVSSDKSTPPFTTRNIICHFLNKNQLYLMDN